MGDIAKKETILDKLLWGDPRSFFAFCWKSVLSLKLIQLFWEFSA